MVLPSLFYRSHSVDEFAKFGVWCIPPLLCSQPIQLAGPFLEHTQRCYRSGQAG